MWVHLSVVAAQPAKAFYKEVLKALGSHFTSFKN